MTDDNIDLERIDECTLALLMLGLHDHERAWKSFDWNVLNRLHERGLIGNPVNKAKSVEFTAAGLKQSEAAFDRLFWRHRKPDN